jgi:phosphoglycolate phosphatase
MTLLVLFDVDGTLLLRYDPLATRALLQTLRTRFGVDLPEDAVKRTDHRGQTSLRIARLVLRGAGLGDEAIDAGLADWCTDYSDRYLELLGLDGSDSWEPPPGAASALSRMEEAGLRLALLTGNPEPVARARMERLGLAARFASGQGAFGCEAEARGDLFDLALERAGGWPVAHTVAVGDTVRDVESAHEKGIRAIAVSFRGGSDEPFPDADAVCDDFDEVCETLLGWAGR